MTRLFLACGGRQPLPGERRDQSIFDPLAIPCLLQDCAEDISIPELPREAEERPAPTLGASLYELAGPSASVVEWAGALLRRGE